MRRIPSASATHDGHQGASPVTAIYPSSKRYRFTAPRYWAVCGDFLALARIVFGWLAECRMTGGRDAAGPGIGRPTGTGLKIDGIGSDGHRPCRRLSSCTGSRLSRDRPCDIVEQALRPAGGFIASQTLDTEAGEEPSGQQTRPTAGSAAGLCASAIPPPPENGGPSPLSAAD
jgi:hypothetical protein